MMIKRQLLITISVLCCGIYDTAFSQYKAIDNPKTLEKTQQNTSTADHTKFESLQKNFKSGQEVTQACLSCHTEADNQLMHTTHYTWAFKHPKTKQQLGKRYVVNSFCGNVASNEARCTSCHTGYGWTDMRKAPPTDPNAVDCLVCHDNSGQYAKLATRAGLPALAPLKPKDTTITGKKAWAVDLSQSAQSVGKTSRQTCGNCHFYGGGGDNVKHGDLSSALYDPSYEVDVHMSKDGANMNCSTCHVQSEHRISGSRYATLPSDHAQLKPGKQRSAASCQSCHGEKPHNMTSIIGHKINDHTDKVACQSCHIPEFARGGIATKTLWDWSTAGNLKDGKPYAEHNYTQTHGNKALHTYLSKKGTFEWGENVVPYYAWFDGQIEYTNTDRKINPAQIVSVNHIKGDAKTPNARIWPFKRMLGKQPYDTETNELVYSHLFGPGTKTAFWGNYDWQKSITHAMAYMNEPYSGHYDFAKTEMFWPITHMVAPKEQAVDCQSCHAKNGRMANISGIYLPGQEKSWGFFIGLTLLILTIIGVLGHTLIRLFSTFKRSAS